MRWPPKAALVLLIGILAAAAPLADPDLPRAQANVVCDPPVPDPGDAIGAIGDAVGIGNPVGDACETVTDPILGLPGKALDPLKDAASAIGNGVFGQVTSWVADGAVWLIGEVAVISEKTTSPDLLSRGFIRQYRLMSMIAAFMAALMLIFAVFESLGRGDAGMLGRVFFVNLPLAAIATTVAYVVVQLLIAVCDGMCVAISHSAGADSKEFFKGAVEALAKAGASGDAVARSSIGGPGAGGAVGDANGAVAVPLFVGFIAAILAAFAAFFVWIELLMRDAAIYVVALFMPLAIAASIWPRWLSALRRTCELLIVVIFSKFVIVAIVSLAASLLAKNDGAVEHVLAAGAMLLLACFAPFVLFKLVPFAEEATSAAFSRQSATGGAVRTVEFANSTMMVQRLSQANWAAASAGQGSNRRSDPQAKSAGGTSGSGSGAAGGGAIGGAVPVAAAAAAGSGRSAAGKLSSTGEASAAEGAADQKGDSPGPASAAAPGAGHAEGAPRPAGAAGSEQARSPDGDGAGTAAPSPRPGGGGAEPQDAQGGGGAAAGGEAAPRPPAEKRDAGASGSER